MGGVRPEWNVGRSDGLALAVPLPEPDVGALMDMPGGAEVG